MSTSRFATTAKLGISVWPGDTARAWSLKTANLNPCNKHLHIWECRSCGRLERMFLIARVLPGNRC